MASVADYVNLESFATTDVMHSMVQHIAKEYPGDYVAHILDNIDNILTLANRAFITASVNADCPPDSINMCDTNEKSKEHRQIMLCQYAGAGHAARFQAIGRTKFGDVPTITKTRIIDSVYDAIHTFIDTTANSWGTKMVLQPHLDGSTPAMLLKKAYAARVPSFDSVYAYNPTCTGRACAQMPAGMRPNATDADKALLSLCFMNETVASGLSMAIRTEIDTLIGRLVKHIVSGGNRWYPPAGDIQNKQSYDIQEHLRPTGFTAWVLREANTRCIPFCANIGRAYTAAPPTTSALLVPGSIDAVPGQGNIVNAAIANAAADIQILNTTAEDERTVWVAHTQNATRYVEDRDRYEQNYRVTDDDRRNFLPNKYFVLDVGRSMQELNITSIRATLTRALDISEQLGIASTGMVATGAPGGPTRLETPLVISKPRLGYPDEYATYLQF